MGKWFKWAGVVVLLLGGFVLGGIFSHSFKVTWGGKLDVQYADMIAVVLTALSVIITVLAIFLAILGVLGWNSISRGVKSRASEFLDEGFGADGDIRKMVAAQVEANTNAYLAAQFAEGGEMRNMVRNQVSQFAYTGFDPVTSDDEPDVDGGEASE